MLQSGEAVTITGDGLKPAASGLAREGEPEDADPPRRRHPAVRSAKGDWTITQLPEVEGAFVALDPRTGAIRAMVGGFDYSKSKFNHVTQAWRQPGSSFKPFIYSAALEKGFTPATVINDAPLFFDAGATGSQPWEPKNYDGKFDGPMRCGAAWPSRRTWSRSASCSRSAPPYAQDYITRFGFDAEQHPAYLTMALGAGSVTPLQMASAYASSPTAATASTRADRQDHRHAGPRAERSAPPALDESMRAIDARNAFVMTSLLQEVTRSGTAAKAQAHAQAARHLRQDRHHQRLARRLVRRLAARRRRGRLDGLRHPAQARRPRDRRRPVTADLDRLHEQVLKGVPVHEPTPRRGS